MFCKWFENLPQCDAFDKIFPNFLMIWTLLTLLKFSFMSTNVTRHVQSDLSKLNAWLRFDPIFIAAIIIVSAQHDVLSHTYFLARGSYINFSLNVGQSNTAYKMKNMDFNIYLLSS